jgi:hypothetical protein
MIRHIVIPFLNEDEEKSLRNWLLSDKAYAQARRRGFWRKIFLLAGRPKHRLLSLDEYSRRLNAANLSYEGLRTVKIEMIRGSEGRLGDFDIGFCPLKAHDRERWLRIASILLSGRELPPVDLIRIGNVYFVRDGHHRISAAKALGRLDIEAYVTALSPSRPEVPGPICA